MRCGRVYETEGAALPRKALAPVLLGVASPVVCRVNPLRKAPESGRSSAPNAVAWNGHRAPILASLLYAARFSARGEAVNFAPRLIASRYGTVLMGSLSP